MFCMAFWVVIDSFLGECDLQPTAFTKNLQQYNPTFRGIVLAAALSGEG